MKYNDLTINKLRDLSILNVATRLGITLKGTGQEGRRAICPYHNDKNPSLHFSRKKNIFKCFVCGAKGDLFKLVMDHENLTFTEACAWLIKEFNITVVEEKRSREISWTSQAAKPSAPCATLSRNDKGEVPTFHPLPHSYVTQAISVNSTFCQSLVSNGYLTQQQMLHAAERYHLGISKDGGVVFWEIDNTNQVHDGKIMFYSPNCHRDKERHPSWVTAELIKSGRLKSNIDNPKCLFGLHLTTHHPDPLMGRGYLNERATGGAVKSSNIGEDFDGVDASFTSFLRAEEKEKSGLSPSGRTRPIAIVESEKTAIVCSELFPDYIWLASGGKTMLNASLFAPLGDQRIILFPDTDETGETYNLWCTIAQEATKLYKSRIHVSPILEKRATPAQKSAKIDIVDFLFPTL